MAFTRKFLTSLGIDEDKIETIMTAHIEVTDALKAERDNYKADAEKLPDVQKKLDDATKDDYKTKYDAIKTEFDNYKNEVTQKESLQEKKEAYKALLKEAGIADKRIDTVLKVDADVIKNIELDADGSVKDADGIKKKAKESWADFIVTEQTHGTTTANPPADNGGGMTKDQIYATDEHGKFKLSAQERQKAIAENSQLFNQ